MPLLNYTTKIDSDRTIEQIQKILIKHGANSILTNYDSNGQPISLSFKAITPQGEFGYKLPVYPDKVQIVLQKQRVRVSDIQAMRIAWRIVKDWVEAQMAILETEMVTMDQIFLPYMLTQNGQTLYQQLVNSKFQLHEGQES